MGLAGCQIRKARSWHVRVGRGGRGKYSPAPASALGNGVPALYSSTSSPEEGREKRQAAGMGQNRTERIGGGAPSLHWPLWLALAYLRCIYSFRYCCSTITRSVRRSKASARCQSLYHIDTSTHPEREVHEHTSSTLGGACRCAVRKKLPGRGPLALQNPVLMPVQSM